MTSLKKNPEVQALVEKAVEKAKADAFKTAISMVKTVAAAQTADDEVQDKAKVATVKKFAKDLAEAFKS
jgi:ribosomal protein L17